MNATRFFRPIAVLLLTLAASPAYAQQAQDSTDDRGGRELLLAQTAVLGALFYGPGMATAVGARDEQAVGTYLVTTGASFFIPFLLTHDQPVSYGMANLSRYGATRGVAHAEMLEDLFTDDEGSGPAAVTAMMAASVAEGVAGYLWARNERMTPGTAATIGLGGDFGLVWGGSTAGVLGMGKSGKEVLALAGSAAGLYAGRRLARVRNYTWGDAAVVYMGGVAGAGTVAAGLYVLGVEEDRPNWLGLIAGSAAGLWAMDHAVRGKDFTAGQGGLVEIGTVAGALTGLGAGVMADATDQSVAALTLMGGLAGFGLTYAAIRGDAEQEDRGPASSLSIHFTPAALLSGMMDTGASGVSAPLASVEYRF